MKAEQDRIKRQQQYMGAAMGQALYQETAMKEFDNKLTLERKEKHFRDAALKEKHEQF
eukprot:gene40977-55375_t